MAGPIDTQVTLGGSGGSSAAYPQITAPSNSDTPRAAAAFSITYNTDPAGLGSVVSIDSITWTAVDHAGNDVSSQIDNDTAASTTIDETTARAGGLWSATAVAVVGGVTQPAVTITWRVGTTSGLIKEDISDTNRWTYEEGTATVLTAYDSTGMTFASIRADTMNRATLFRPWEDLPVPCTAVMIFECTNPNQNLDRAFGLALAGNGTRTGSRGITIWESGAAEQMTYQTTGGGLSATGSNVRKLVATISVDATDDVTYHVVAYDGSDNDVGELQSGFTLTDVQMCVMAGNYNSSAGTAGTMNYACYTAVYPTP